jgi:hypothetical protein
VSYHEFLQTIRSHNSQAKEDGNFKVDIILTRIAKLAQSQRNRKISRKILRKKIKTIEKSIAQLSGYELNPYKKYLLEETRSIKGGNGGAPCGKGLKGTQPDKTGLDGPEIYEQIASDALRTSSSETHCSRQPWLAQCFFLRQILM